MREIAEGFIIPDFGGAPAATSATAASSADGAPVAAVPQGPRKMAIICSKGNLDMAYPGLILGNAAAGEGAQIIFV